MEGKAAGGLEVTLSTYYDELADGACVCGNTYVHAVSVAPFFFCKTIRCQDRLGTERDKKKTANKAAALLSAGKHKRPLSWNGPKNSTLWAELQVKNDLPPPRFTLQRSLYRDRLGTNIGKLIKDRFLAGGALMAAVDGGADDATRRR